MFLYEEFMARSSTRKAVSGGNFMGMMNVLMQLRKVCNHPDLFEPRSVTTPFVMEHLSMSTASCVVHAVEPKSALDQLSSFLRLPLWTMGQGTPSFEQSTSVDQILAGQLADHMTPVSMIAGNVTDDDLVEPLPDLEIEDGMSSFLSSIRAAEMHERVSRAQFVGGVNKRRCETLVFPYSDRLRRAVSVDPGLCGLPLMDDLTVPQIAATPLELLAMRKSHEDRAIELDEIADKFIFCVPKAGTHKPVLFSRKMDSISSPSEKVLAAKSSTAYENYFAPFKKTLSRLTMCFPDKKLVQFDAGKLQTLATLLRELKHGGHRVLIFTQMSKMLDVLEAFLNLNGHTYLRLDGATDVDRRQRLMDRFNNDSKVFCFILSTRSGGLGINLTGADTVVFYDSDWNPAMDAQAQDRYAQNEFQLTFVLAADLTSLADSATRTRAHRIGQTREVHIYRMITEHSIEENILTKAKQKRNLDFLVMDEGKFHATTPNELAVDDAATEGDTFTKDKLQSILGLYAENEEHPNSNVGDTMSKDQLESAMAALEDEDDVKAMQNSRQEAAEALQEFDESMQDKQDEMAPDGTKKKEDKDEVIKPKNKKLSISSVDSTLSENTKLKQDNASDDEKKMEQEFAQWQRSVGMDANTIHESLNPLERYGLHIKEHIDPHYSKYFWAEQQRLHTTTSTNNEWDIEEIERKKVLEELKAFEDGDLLATFPEPEALPRQRQLYIREKARLRSDTMRRKLTGQNWTTKVDERSGNAFWYNTDTGEALGDKPQVLKMLEAEEVARTYGWSALPHKPLVHIMDYLIPYPERVKCAVTCSKWKSAATDASFVLHVWPVELGALVMDANKLGRNHFRTIVDANRAALPGDSIGKFSFCCSSVISAGFILTKNFTLCAFHQELGDGHYFINDPGLVINKPIKFVGDENEPAHVVLEMSGEIVWKSSGGWMEGVTIRRPRISTGVTPNTEILRIEAGGRLDMFHCVFDNRGSIGNCVSVSGGAGVRWEKASINGGSRGKSGLLIEQNAKVELIDVSICKDEHIFVCDSR
jgi:superfamily II DNA/RNA helicase